jgi:hypothetical protein
MAAMQAARSRPNPEDLFNQIDADGDGSVNATEIQTMADHLAEKMGDAAPSAEDLMAQLDTDSDGVMSFAEFEAGRPQGPPPGGMPPPGMSFSEDGEMDLSSLFKSSDEEEDVTTYDSLYA